MKPSVVLLYVSDTWLSSETTPAHMGDDRLVPPQSACELVTLLPIIQKKLVATAATSGQARNDVLMLVLAVV